MNKTRLEAFSDGVFAIIITIMVLELKIPHGTSWEVIAELGPVFFCYLMSFIYIAIYWNNHHHLMHTVKRVNARIMWSNMLLLFCLSLVPFATGWMGENHFDKIPVATYGVLLILSGISFSVLSGAIKKSYTEETPLTAALRQMKSKERASTILYLLSIPAAIFVSPYVSEVLFVAVAIMWIVPSKYIEKALESEH